MNKSERVKTVRQKKLIIEYLEKMPVLQVACKKAGVNRSSYYRWRNDDEEFMQKTDQALKSGVELVNDMAESKIIQGIQDDKSWAIRFWLTNNCRKYVPKNKQQEDSESTINKPKEWLKKALNYSMPKISKHKK